MNDLLLRLGSNPQARRVVRTLGLPIPLPQPLERARGPWEEKPLEGDIVLVGGAPGASLGDVVDDTLASAGAIAHGIDSRAAVPDQPARALLFDASGIADPAGLHALFDFFHPLVPRLRTGGRVVVLGRAPESLASPSAAAAQQALEGFVRSVAKELGRRGTTAHVVWVAPGAEARATGLVRFLLSRRSAFVSGQAFRVTTQAANGAQPRWTRPLAGRVALVTGAARGIGEATARLLAAEGAHVVVLDRPADEELATTLARDLGGTALVVDLGDRDAPERIAGELTAKFGGVDIVVHNAGITRDRTLAKMSAEQWDQALEINLGAVVRITDALLAGPLRDGGRIVCLSSIAGIAGNMGQTNYSAAKAGLIGFVRRLSGDVAGRGITVNAIAPGFIETRLTAAIPVLIREAGRRLSNLGQGGVPQDVGEAITFLASPGSQGLTSQVIRVCGGGYLGA